MTIHYANAFRTHLTPEEVVVDFGFNMAAPASSSTGGQPGSGPQQDMMFRVSDRIILNYATARRLAMTLRQAIHLHEKALAEDQSDASEPAGR